jgi:hypothetical protein
MGTAQSVSTSRLRKMLRAFLTEIMQMARALRCVGSDVRSLGSALDSVIFPSMRGGRTLLLWST